MFGLIGEKLSHSFSKQIHNLLADYDYNLFPMPHEKVEQFLEQRNFHGLNVTIPYKQTVLPYCNTLSAVAKKIGAVNTLTVLPDGTLHGDNTDYFGFKYSLKKNGLSLLGKKVLVLGSGGASLTAVAVLTDMGSSVVKVISRSGNDNYENISRHHDANIIVNTTPVGMFPNNGKSPIILKEFTKCEFVADMIYNPLKTALLLEAEALGIPFCNGLLMLVAQAKKSAEAFLCKEIPERRIDEITSKLTLDMQNIILIGMPGCGKTTVGTALAKALDRELIDTDAFIEKQSKMSIPEIFQKYGEEYFRTLESSATVKAGINSGKIISTGGGIVIKKENRNALRQNGYVIFLNRDIKLLETEGRPLSKNIDTLKKMYEKRLPLYRSFCDKEIDGNDNINTVINKILKLIS